MHPVNAPTYLRSIEGSYADQTFCDCEQVLGVFKSHHIGEMLHQDKHVNSYIITNPSLHLHLKVEWKKKLVSKTS